jgi:hypothetical protein
MSQRRYTFFTLFFILALLILSSVAMRDYVSGTTVEASEVISG